MAIFKIQNKKLTEIKSKPFPTELELQQSVDENLDKIFGLEFIRREFGGQGLSIDTIAYDPELKSPVLIEYKKDTYQSVIDQGMAYLNWLLSHKGDYQVALTEKLGQREIDWSQPRVIFIARSFNVHQIYASGFKNAPFELYRYNLYDDIFLLEPVETPKSDVSITSVLKTKEVRQIAKQIETYTLADHFNKANDDTKMIFEKLRESILALDERIQERPVKTYIGYKVRYFNFVAIEFYKNKLKVFIRAKEIEDPKKLFEDWWQAKLKTHTSLWRAQLKSIDEIDYIFDVIKQAYQSAPDL